MKVEVVFVNYPPTRKLSPLRKEIARWPIIMSGYK